MGAQWKQAGREANAQKRGQMVVKLVRESGGNNDNVAREVRMLEPSGSGVNYTAFKAQAQAGDISYTLPNSAPTAANQVLQVQSVAGNNATLSWGTIGGSAIIFNRNADHPIGFADLNNG